MDTIRTLDRFDRAIIDILKQEPPQSAEDLAGRLGISAMAVRQHLYGLREEKLVAFEDFRVPYVGKYRSALSLEFDHHYVIFLIKVCIER